MHPRLRFRPRALTQLLLFTVGLIPLAWETGVGAAPSVSNVAATQRPGTKLVDITYDLDGDGLGTFWVSLAASSDGGATFSLPVTSVTGAIGQGVIPGVGKSIVWDAGTDWGGNFGAQIHFRIITENEFSEVPAGSFSMGRTSGDTDANAPPITVSLSSFLIQRTETTKAQWDAVRAWAINNGYTDLAAGTGKGPNHPVQNVSWWDTVKWCNARSEMEGLTPSYRDGGNVVRGGTPVLACDWSADGYRLPTEAEWEKAARGGISGKRFSWGSDLISHSLTNFRNEGGEVYASGPTGYNSNFVSGDPPFTSPVGSFAPNNFGLWDMTGNVWEWCWDWLGATYYSESNGTTNPRGPASGSIRMLRGGAWDSLGYGCAVSFRYDGGVPTHSFNAGGFRPVRSRTFGTLAEIPAGNVTLGVNPGDPEADAPITTVFVDTFYLQKTETTREQWDTVRTWALAHGYTDLEPADGKAPSHPVTTVRWIETVKWCNARSEMEGLRPCYYVGGLVLRTGSVEPYVDWSANGYRLPTEAEWEKAARGGVSGKRFPWSADTITHTEANYLSTTGHAYDVSPTRGTHPDWTDASSVYSSPVGSFSPNAYGLYDMSGNMWEWCWDRYGETYYSQIGGTSNPRGPSVGSNRVIRGGSWNRNAAYSRSGYRLSHGALSSTGSDGGFRPARGHLVDNFSDIPDGVFTMGASSGDAVWDDPPTTVMISAFRVEKTETTKGQWDIVRAWALNNGYTDLAVGDGVAADHPVHTVGWYNVVKWCNARSEMEGLTPCYSVAGNVMRTGTSAPDSDWNANGYRLPTEAEWERIARGGVTGLRFPWGDAISHDFANFNNSNGEPYSTGTTGFHPRYFDGTPSYTSPSDGFTPHGFDVKNIIGNVWEFCWDRYDASYYVTSNGTTDPRGPIVGHTRMIRGGSWNSDATNCRSSYRTSIVPTTLSISVGFRSVRKPHPTSFEINGVSLDTRSNDATLSALTLSDGVLDPVFAPATDTYTASFANAVSTLTVTPTISEPNAVIQVKINDGAYTSVSSGNVSGSLPLLVGQNFLVILVTAQDTTTTKTYTTTVSRDKASQTISFDAITDQLANASIDLAASGGTSGNPVTFSVTAPGQLSGNTLTFTGAGSVTVTANQAGNATHHAADPVSHTFGVTKANATVNLSGLTQVYNGAPRPVTATADPQGLQIHLTYEGSVSPPTNAGTYEVIGTIVSAIYQGSSTANLLVSRAGQTINFAPIIDQLATASILLDATGGGSGEPLAFVVESGPAVLGQGNLLTFTGAGEVQIRASQAGNANHDPADAVTHTFEVVLPRPDAAVGLSLGSLSGVGVYGTSGQQLTLVSRFARPVTGFATLANWTILSDRRAADRIAVQANPGNRFFRVTYSDEDGNATAGIISGSYRTPAIDGTDAIRWLTARVSPSKARLAVKKGKRTVYLRKTFTTTVRASSTLYPPASDAGVIRVLAR
jgi:formylglycine-generating enzyme required for sulfatase activity